MDQSAYDGSGRKRKYRSADRKQEVVTSQLILNISNWGFVRDLTQQRSNRFIPCSVQDVHIAIKLSSNVFKPIRNNDNDLDPDQREEFYFDKNGAILPFAAFISLMKDASFTGEFMKEVKAKYDADTVKPNNRRNRSLSEEVPITKPNLAEIFEELREPLPLTNRSISLPSMSMPPPFAAATSSKEKKSADHVSGPRSKRAAALAASVYIAQAAKDNEEIKARKKKASKTTLPEASDDDDEEETGDVDNDNESLTCSEELDPERSPKESTLDSDLLALASSAQTTSEFCRDILEFETDKGASNKKPSKISRKH